MEGLPQGGRPRQAACLFHSTCIHPCIYRGMKGLPQAGRTFDPPPHWPTGLLSVIYRFNVRSVHPGLNIRLNFGLLAFPLYMCIFMYI